MTRLLLFVLFAAIFAGTSCKERTSDIVMPSDDITTGQGTVTKVGQPIGQSSTKTIGPAGGYLTSFDTRFTLTIPAGALKENTAISITPIENTAPIGVGTSYSIMPADIKFARPATVSYQYGDQELNGTDKAQLGLAFQQSDQSWAVTRNATLHEEKKQILSKVNQTGNTSIISKYVLLAEKKSLIPSEEVKLVLTYTEDFDPANSPDSDIFVPIRKLGQLTDIREWTINGISQADAKTGSILVKPENKNKAIFYYTAPAKLPAKGNRVVAVGIKLAKGNAPLLVFNFDIRSAGLLAINGKKYEDLDVKIRHHRDQQGASSYTIMMTELSGKAPIPDFSVSILGWFAGPKTYILKGGREEMQKTTFTIGGPARGGNGTYSSLYIEHIEGEIGNVVFDPATLDIEQFTGPGLMSSGKIDCKLYLDTDKAKHVKVEASFSGIVNVQ